MSKRMGRTESVGDSLCPVCHEHTEIFAIGPCDHPICYRCSTRMRVLCDQMYCPICRGDLPQIVFLTRKQKYDEVERRNCIPNRKFKILLEDESVEEAYEALLEFRCRVCEKGPLFDSFPALQTHIRRTHSLFFCDLCVSHLKIFPFERKFYNRKDLATHRRTGDPDNRSYRGHPLCRFCDERYMDNDELYRHLRKSHYYCHFCDANNSNEYFNDYPDLKEHFRTEHFLCTQDHCGSSHTRFTNAFASEIDLKAHKTSEHLGNMSRAQAKELRTIDVSFPVAPRRRGYDASVTSPEDEDINGSGRGYRDRRSKRNESRPDSYSRPSNPTPPPEPVPTPSPADLGGDDFPTLGNAPAPYVPAAQKKPAERSEDFPSLSAQRPPSSSATATSSLTSSALRSNKSNSGPRPGSRKQPTFSSLAAVVTSSSTGTSQLSGSIAQSRPVEDRPAPASRAVSASMWAAPRLASGEDFPSLGSDKKKEGPNYVNLGAWSKKQKRDNAPKPSSARNDVQSKRRSPEPTSLAALGHAFNDDGDFPSLGGDSSSGAVTQQASWVVKNAKPNKNSKSCNSTPLGKTRDPTLNNKAKREETVLVNGSSETKTEGSNSKKKKKKQKACESDSTSSSKAATEDSGISLSSIASEIDAAAVMSLSNPSAISETSKPKQEKQDAPVLNNCSVNSFKETSTSSQLHDDVPTEQAPSDEGKENKQENKQWEKVASKKGKTFKDDDFPSLQAALPKTAPPPGFQKTGKVTAPPPGLNKMATSLGRIPPGLGSTVTLPPSSSSTSSGSNLTSIPLSVQLGYCPYNPPPEAADRNRSLVARVRQLLENKFAGFDQFRTLSAEYRANQVTAQEYHRRCQDLLGKEKFREVLPELVVLLPDILKQHELAQAHKEDILGTCDPLDLQPCFRCHQLLKAEDLNAHLSIHVDLASAGCTVALPIQT